MKRLISLVLCSAMLMSMVVFTSSAAYATSLNWGLKSEASGGVVPNPDHYAGYGDVGYQFTGDMQKSTQMAILQNGSNPTDLDFTFYTGLYITSTYSVRDRSVWCIGSANGASAYYDFNRDKFVIQWTGSDGWECDYDNAGANKVELDYDLPLNQWFNIGIRMSNSVIAIYLNGEEILSVDGHGYAAGDAVLCWPIGINGYMDNLQMFDDSGSKLIGSTNYLSSLDISSGETTNSYLSMPYNAGMTLYTSTIPVGVGYCGVQWAIEKIAAAHTWNQDDITDTAECKARIDAAEASVKALSPSQLSAMEADGTGMQYLWVLNEAVNKYNAIPVVNQINALGTNFSAVSYTTEWKDKIESAEAAYNALGDTNKYPNPSNIAGAPKSAVSNYAHLEQYRIMYNQLANEVTAFINAVNALPQPATNTTVCANAIAAADTAYTALNDAGQKSAVADYKSRLETYRTQYNAAVNNQTAVTDVIAKIKAIGTVTYTDVSKAKINTARAAYDALNPAQQALVTNYSILTAAETTYANLKAQADANNAAANAVIAKINAIGTVTLEDADAIDAARAAYDVLTPAQKALVTNYSILTAAETAYANLKAQADADQAAANSVINKINQIGEVSYTTPISKIMIDDARTAYDALTPAQKALVTNYKTLTDAEAEYSRLEAEANNQSAANVVIDMINAIGDVALDDADAITAARSAYETLTADQQKLVSNIVTLEAAEARINTLTNAKKAADAVVAQIKAIGSVTLGSGDAITAAEAAYAGLSDEAKGLVTNYSTLTAARTAYNELVVNDYISRVNTEVADVTIANKADITALIDEYSSVMAVVPATKPLLMQKMSQALSKLNSALSAIEDLEETNKPDPSEVNKVKATSLTISDSLAVNYKIEVDSSYEIVRMEFTLAGVTTSVTEYTTDASGRLVFVFDNIAPDLMGETITSVIVVKDADENEISCTPAEYSIATYAGNKIATEGLTELLASMVSYGDAAVAYTAKGYTAPSAAIENWTDYADDVAAVRDYTSIRVIGSELAAPEVTWGSASLILSDSVDICIKLGEVVSDGYYAKTFYGEEFKFDVVTENGESYIVWDLYNAAQMSSAVTFTIYDAAGNAVSNSLTYSVESYVADMLSMTDDEDLKNLLTAMMQYGDAALAYNLAANG